MAGGEGSRLRPLTVGRPKPMVPIVNKAVIGHILDLLRSHGITEVVITLRYMASSIQDFLDDGKNYGVNLTYSVEETPLGTAGSVKNAAHLLGDDEPFLGHQRRCADRFRSGQDYRFPSRTQRHGHIDAGACETIHWNMASSSPMKRGGLPSFWKNRPGAN